MEKEKRSVCPRCENTKGQYIHGKNRGGSQRYRCRHCGVTYTPEPNKYAYTEEERNRALKIYYEGNSGRAVGRICGMSKSNVFRWIKEEAEQIPEPEPTTSETAECVDVIELDELFWFVGKKGDPKARKTSM